MSVVTSSISKLETLSQAALVASGASEDAARSVARAVVKAESEGNNICGLLYIPLLCEQLKYGKIDGQAQATVEITAPGAITVDAADGLAHPAIDLGLPYLVEATKKLGIAAMTVKNSTNCLALSHFVLPLAQESLIGLGFANCPAIMAPPGGKTPVLGTNPIAMAIPGKEGPMIVIDQSTSAVAMTELILRRDRGELIPEGWALDQDGMPTTDPTEGLLGSMTPNGGHKGFGVALIVEVLSAALSGAQLSSQASPYFGDQGGPSRTGQSIIAIDPLKFNPGFTESIEHLCHSIESQSGTRIPGKNRHHNIENAKKNGLLIDSFLLRELNELISQIR
ncbi:Ldh family oxidoreductase [Kiloniella antarctica]|uniref:Ldh family oxidoreductase n=1 Tax=Kiloniella antarctica TaxID=1550907 RepID=A0ABW5BN76_9PROT